LTKFDNFLLQVLQLNILDDGTKRAREVRQHHRTVQLADATACFNGADDIGHENTDGLNAAKAPRGTALARPFLPSFSKGFRLVNHLYSTPWVSNPARSSPRCSRG